MAHSETIKFQYVYQRPQLTLAHPNATKSRADISPIMIKIKSHQRENETHNEKTKTELTGMLSPG
jgi:hypothetical protein